MTAVGRPFDLYKRASSIMDFFLGALAIATLLCSLVAGFLFAFAVVAMPGIRNLGDGEFIRAFQVMDQVIQNNQPIFMIVWVGSAVLLLVALFLGLGQVAGIDLLLLIASAVVYIVGVQLPTIVVNVPLNNRLQMIDVAELQETECSVARNNFEPRWNRWNVIRTFMSSITTALLIVLLVRL